jgi:hypothetical protein
MCARASSGVDVCSCGFGFLAEVGAQKRGKRAWGSCKLENHTATVALPSPTIFIEIRRALRVSPAMAADSDKRPLEREDLVAIRES